MLRIDTEAEAVILRGAGEQAQEAPAHGLLGSEPAALRDPLHRLTGFRQHLASRLDPQALDGAGRRDPGVLGVAPAEAALAHARLRREGRERQVGIEMGPHPVMQRLEPVSGRLQRQRRAELRLPAGALEEDDEVARDRQRRRPAEIRLDEGQREVDAGGHPRGGPDRAVAQKNRIGLDPHRREAPGEGVAEGPVSHGPPAVEPAGCGQEEGAGAHGSDPPRPLRALPQPSDQFGIAGRRIDAGTAGHDQGVDRLARGRRRRQRLRREGETGGAGDGAAALGDDAQPVGRRAAEPRDVLIGGGEDLERPGHVEHLHAGEGEHLHDPRPIWRDTRVIWHSCQNLPR